MRFTVSMFAPWVVTLLALTLFVSPPIVQAEHPQCPAAAPVDSLPGNATNPWIRAHEFATGAGVRVAVIDTGIHPHPYLPPVEPIADLVDGAHQGALNDCDGHGTIVAGVLAGRGPLGGVAPDIELMSIRQTSNFAPDASAAGTLDSLAEAIELALDHRAQVINISVVSCVPGRGQPMETVLDAALARAERENAVIVAAAGNLTADCKPDSAVLPAHSPTVLAVSASKDSHTIAPYSIPKLESTPQLSAAGLVKFAASPRDEGFSKGMLGPQGAIVPFEGTSFSAPVVTGTAALLKQRFPEATAAEIRARIVGSAEQGTGNVDPYAALTWIPANYQHVNSQPISTTARGSTQPITNRAVEVAMLLLLGATLVAMLLHRKGATNT